MSVLSEPALAAQTIPSHQSTSYRKRADSLVSILSNVVGVCVCGWVDGRGRVASLLQLHPQDILLTGVCHSAGRNASDSHPDCSTSTVCASLLCI